MSSEGLVHRYPVTVQFDEVDQYGIVHHSKYFIYLERARVDLLARLQMKHGISLDEQTAVIVAGAEIKYRSSARFLDELLVECGPKRVGATKLVLGYRVLRGDEIVCESELTLAFLGGNGRPTRAPAPLREALAGYRAP